MNKLLFLRFYLLPLAAHCDFFVKLYAILLSATQPVRSQLSALTITLSRWLLKEETLLSWIRKSELTEQIFEADREIGRILAAINYAIQTSLRSSIQATKASANRVHIMLQNYGRIANEPYDEEAGKIRALLKQFAGTFAQDATTLGLTAWITELTTVFNTFETLLRQRETDQGEKPNYTASEVRKGIEDVYHQIVVVVEANSIAGENAEDFEALIKLLNPDIERLNAEFQRTKKDLGAGDHTVIEEIATQQYSGKAITVIPKVYYREDGHSTVELTFAKDFTVTYKNNIEVGMARLTIHGKGKYKGSQTTTFNIART